MKIISFIFDLIISFILIISSGFLAVGLFTPDVEWLQNKNPQSTAFIDYRKEQAISEGKKYYVKMYWRSFNNIPRAFRQAVIFNEDGMFYLHNGFDWFELRQTFEGFFFANKKLRGASTITQQLAKNLFLSPDRSFLRKVREYWIASDLEAKLTKNRILEIYLNIAEWGPGIFGCQAGAKYWYRKSIHQLDYDEMAAMASILPAPLKWSPKAPNKLVRLKSRRAVKYLELIGFSKHSRQELARPLNDKATALVVPDEMKAIRELVEKLVRDSILP